jgi:hypothetical protein
MRLRSETKRIWIMNIASHNLIGSARHPEPLMDELDRRAVGCDEETSQMSSAERGREGRDPGNPRPSRAFSGDFADLVHELANTTTAVLMNAQVLGWKLPPYSRLKRPLREIERNAQRGGELMKRLLSRLATSATEPGSETGPCGNASSLGLTNTVTAQEPGVDSGSAVNLRPRMNSHPAPVFLSGHEVELTSPCDACTSTFPKKG